MQYIISFLEGVITFISPCLLPMLPVYVSYFTCSVPKENTKKTVYNALGFILGFTLVFVLLGAFAGLLGGYFLRHQKLVNLISGGIVVLFGLNYLGILKIRFLNNSHSWGSGKISGFFSSVLFGIVFSLGWTPCVGVFLGSALMLASQQGSAVKGILMLLCYSLGLGIPFLISALLIERLKTTFNFIKRNYRTVTLISGIFLIVVGILMMTGMMGWFLSTLTF